MNTARAPGESFRAAFSIVASISDRSPSGSTLAVSSSTSVSILASRRVFRSALSVRVTAILRQRAKDLDPHFLRNVRGRVYVISHEPPHHRIDVRRVTGPQRTHRRLVAVDGAFDGEGFGFH